MTFYDLVREGTEKRIDFLFNKNVKKENAYWDYYVMYDSEIIIHYHYWTYNNGVPCYNTDTMKVINE